MDGEYCDPLGEGRRFRRMMGNFLGGGFGTESPEGFRAPLTDIIDEGNELVACLELPGVRKEDIEITVTPEMLKVKVEKKGEKEEEDKGYYYKERSYGGYYRAFSLPAGVIPEHVKAKYNNGILEVRMKKKVKTEGGKGITVE